MNDASSVGRKRIALNSVWNVVGQALPILIAIATLPLIIRNLGLERYGLLSLIWVLIGYAGLFDMGIGRALTRLVARGLADGEHEAVSKLVRSGLCLLLGCGALVGLAFAAVAPYLSKNVLNVSPALASEANLSLRLVAVSIPVAMLTSGYTGIMSAHQRFKPLNLIRLCMGLLTYGGPAALSFVTPSLPAAVGLLALMRFGSTVVHALVCKRYCGLDLGFGMPRRGDVDKLLSLGGWITVSNVVSPLLSYLDRFVVATLVPIGFLAYYATSFDLLSRSMMLPYSITAAMFPIAAAVVPKSEAATRALREMARALFGVMFPVTFSFFVLARPGLSLWLGTDFAFHSVPVLQILAIGVLVNTLAQAPATLIQAAGQPRSMAIAHLIELPIFVLVLWLLTQRYGIVGAAVAAALRQIIDALIVTLISMRSLVAVRFKVDFAVHVAFVVSLFAGSLLTTSTLGTVAYLLTGLIAFAGYFWARLLSHDDRRGLRAWRAQAMASRTD